jgi:hypothetical protein
MERVPRVLWSVEKIAAALPPEDRPAFAKEWMELLARWQLRAEAGRDERGGVVRAAPRADDLIADWQL